MTVRASFNTRRGNARILPIGDVVGWQEVNDPPDRRKLAAALPSYTHYVPDVEWAAAIPISWRAARFELVDKGKVLAHGGAAGITPARGCTWVLLRDLTDGSLVWHVNVHFISKIRLSNWRRLQWAEHLRTLQQLTDALLMHSPYGTVGGDFNNHNPVKIPGLVNLTPRWRGDQVWYDQLLVTEALATGASVERGKSRLGSDHFPFMLTYQPPKVEPPTEPPEETVPTIPESGPHQPKRRFTDSSGRGVWATDWEWRWWEAVVFVLGFRPTITQSPWQKLNGGGAPDSAGYHDFGGTFDLRVRDLTTAQIFLLLWVLRLHGAAAYLRNTGVFASDPHIHFVICAAPNKSDGAKWQVRDYAAGGNALSGSSHGPDPHRRPDPIVIKPTREMFMPTPDEIDALLAKRLQPLEEKLAAVIADVPAKVWKVKGTTIKPDERTPTYGRMLEETHNRAKQARDAHDEPEPPAA